MLGPAASGNSHGGGAASGNSHVRWRLCHPLHPRRHRRDEQRGASRRRLGRKTRSRCSWERRGQSRGVAGGARAWGGCVWACDDGLRQVAVAALAVRGGGVWGRARRRRLGQITRGGAWGRSRRWRPVQIMGGEGEASAGEGGGGGALQPGREVGTAKLLPVEESGGGGGASARGERWGRP
ncbi:hypothetical protein ACQJBY_022366 [Aegilops geniculata]